MSKYRRAAKIDSCQTDIVKQLRAAGVTVEVSHDDILVGYAGRTLWVELKDMATWKKKGGLKAGTFKDSQLGLLRSWKGDYLVAWTAEQILEELGL